LLYYSHKGYKNHKGDGKNIGRFKNSANFKIFACHQITKTPNSSKVKRGNYMLWCPEISGLATCRFGGKKYFLPFLLKPANKKIAVAFTQQQFKASNK